MYPYNITGSSNIGPSMSEFQTAIVPAFPVGQVIYVPLIAVQRNKVNASALASSSSTTITTFYQIRKYRRSEFIVCPHEFGPI